MSSRKSTPATEASHPSKRSSFNSEGTSSSRKSSTPGNNMSSSSKTHLSILPSNKSGKSIDPTGRSRSGKTSFLGSLVTRRVQFSKKLTSTLILYFLMVYYGVKDAYLIDIHSFRRSAAVTWLADCCHTLGLDTQRVMVLMLDSDCFFVNIAILREKLHHIEEGTLDVLVIDLDADPVSIKAYSDCTELQEQLTRALPLLERYVLTAGNHPQPVSGSINTDKEPYTQIGSPFLAGLLLGYPCVYLAKPEVTVETGGPPKDEKKKRNEVTFDGDEINEEDNDNNNDMKVGCYQRASGKLSYSLLSKVTTSVRLKFKTDLEEFGTHLVGRQIPLLEFTYPQYLMENVEEDVDHLITTAIEKFRGVCAKKYETFEDSNDFLALESRIFLNEEVISTEVISL